MIFGEIVAVEIVSVLLVLLSEMFASLTRVHVEILRGH